MGLKINSRVKKYFDEHIGIIRSLFDEHNHVEEAKRRLLVALPFWFAAFVTAGLAVFYARAFQVVEKESLKIFSDMGYWALIIVPLLFLLSWFVVDRYAPFSNGSGIPQLLAAAELSQHNSKNLFLEKLLGFRIIFVKVISSLLGVLGGGAIGREGPTLQIAGSVFHLTGKFISKKNAHFKNQHVLILAGGAAGLASAFNTPLGGIAYVVEELSKSHLSSFRTGILHSVIVAGLISQLILGPYLYFGYPKMDTFQMNQIWVIILISIIIGIIAALFGQTLKLVVVYRDRLNSKKKKAALAIVCGFAIACSALFASTSVLGSGKDLLNGLLFTDNIASLSDVVSRFFGTVVTYAVGGAGGIFAPTLSLGGAGASYFGNLMGENLGPVGVLIGMTAALSALTQSPLTSFVLILEMTDRHSAIFPLMIAALIGQGVSKFISNVSFYDFVCLRILSTQASDQSNGLKQSER
jgi:H+/Cl- antiporter ClcA